MRLILLGLFVLCLQAPAQILLRINDAAPVTISTEDLAKLPRHNAALNDHGKQVNYEGVLLRDVLTKGGIDVGQGLHGKQLSTYVAAIAGDGYQVVYTLADVDPTIADAGIIVADKREGQPLAPTEGPLRIVVPNDKRPARCLKLLREIDVVQLRK